MGWSFESEIGILQKRGEIPQTLVGISQDSRRIKSNYVFLARRGQVDGLSFLSQAINNGAVLLITESELPEILSIPALRVTDVSVALNWLSHELFGYPSDRVQIFGITGTNGKTSTTYILKSILEVTGEKCGLIGTLEYHDGKERLDSSLTTPDIDLCCELFSRMSENGCKYVVMEVSSHGLALGRVNNVKYWGAGITNVSQDHLDFHKDMESYAAAKSKLFEMLEHDKTAVINMDDEWAEYMKSRCSSEVISYGRTAEECDVRIIAKSQSKNGNHLELKWRNKSIDIHSPLIGAYQCENIALAASLAISNGMGLDEIREGVERLRSVPGRLERIDCGQPFSVFVDYAHTPDALRSAIGTVKPLYKGDLTLIFGCGGDRDQAKRPKMGTIAVGDADKVILTNDNPRTEDPSAIVDEIIDGIDIDQRHKVEIILDRRDAIEKGILTCDSNGVIVVAGKGAERNQTIGNSIIPFDDRVVVQEQLVKMGYVNSMGTSQ